VLLPVDDELPALPDVLLASTLDAGSLVSTRLTITTIELHPALKIIRTHRDGMLASIRLGVFNGRVRSIIARSYGFHSAKATLALVSKLLGPIDLKLPYRMPLVLSEY